MGPDIVERALSIGCSRLRVLDPMMGSGTTLVWSRIYGHTAFGVDRDPLAVLIATSSTRDLDVRTYVKEADEALLRARKLAALISQAEAYPTGADDETKKYVRYWFDVRARTQLAALVRVLSRNDFETLTHLKLALSRMIVTKSHGVSLALDASHSRPHRDKDWKQAPTSPFEAFPRQVKAIAERSLFTTPRSHGPIPRIVEGDCRRLHYPREFFDLVITSPPYLNAIDYLRGHKLSLVWLGYSAEAIRDLRSTNVGADCGIESGRWDDIIETMLLRKTNVPNALIRKVRRYASDLDRMMGQIARVTRCNGKIIMVVGDCTIRGVEVRNSYGVVAAAERHDLTLVHRRIRRIKDASRYLPPPAARFSEGQIANRMRHEVVLEFRP